MLTSPRLYQALLQKVFRLNSPKRVLLVGAQIPALVIKMIRSLHEGDELVVIDGLSTQLASLRERLEAEPGYRCEDGRISLTSPKFVENDDGRGRGQATLVNKLLWELDMPGHFEAIVLSYPIDLLSDDMLKKTMEACTGLLVPGGTVSCLEMAWLRKLRNFVTSCWRRNSCQPVQPTCLERYIDSFRVYKETIATDLPPVWVDHLRFTPSPAQGALNIHAVEGRASLSLGPIKIAKDFLKFVLPLVTCSWGLKKWKCSFWYFPLFLLAGVAAFLRDPRRTIHEDREAAFSACDGKVLDVSVVSDPNLGEGKQWLRIATFLSLFNTHINRAPVCGKVVDMFDVKGGYANASLPKANHNYSTYVILENEHGTVVVAQRVGCIARRIYNWVTRGELLAQGERYGLIRMGSRTDVYLPADKYQALVKAGDHVQAGLTKIAVLKQD